MVSRGTDRESPQTAAVIGLLRKYELHEFCDIMAQADDYYHQGDIEDWFCEAISDWEKGFRPHHGR